MHTMRRAAIRLGIVVLVFQAIPYEARAQDDTAVASQTAPTYTPTGGFKVADTPYGDLNIRVFTYLRYLNQQGTDDSYTNAFGRTSAVQQRQDLQLNKAQVYFFGWIMSRKFRYNTYVWTSNASLGQSGQVVLAGSLNYTFNEHFTFGGGIGALPGVRSTDGNFPFWLTVDSRQIADEFFRPSFTTGLWARGKSLDKTEYNVMIGNNLSQFGIDAGQLDGKLNSFAASFAWMPTTGEFGKAGRLGDYDNHEKLATRIAAHITRSDETRQGQPNTDAFDNVQLRVSDGSVIFSPGLFVEDLQIEEATYNLFSLDGGLKYRGFSLEWEFFKRRLDNFVVRGTGALPFEALRDSGFQFQSSTMLVPQQLQIYGGGSKVFGAYGDPYDLRLGVNLFPWKNEVVRWNFEFIQLRRSPVGGLSLPYSVGSDGPVFHSSFMLWL